MPSYRPLALTTARLLARRWWLYALGTLVVFCIQAVVQTFVHVKTAQLFTGLIALPLLIAVTTAVVGADATNSLTAAQRLERILERAWAVILIDMGITFVSTSGLFTIQAGAQGGDGINVLYGFLTILLAGMLVYAEPFIMLEKDVQTLTLLPFAVLRSMMLAWVNVSRIFALLALQMALDLAVLFAEQKSGAGTRLWIEIIVNSAVTAPLAALYTVAYLDTVSQERRSIAQ